VPANFHGVFKKLTLLLGNLGKWLKEIRSYFVVHWRMALKDTGLIRAKKQKGLSNFTTRKFHLTNRQNAAKKFVRCTLKTR
jgi:hypothetical protein